MSKQRSNLTYKVIESVESLSTLIGIDEDRFENYKELLDYDHEARGLQWLDLDSEERTIENLKTTLRSVFQYLKDLYQNDRQRLKEIDTQKGVKAVIILASEAIHSLDRFQKPFSRALKGRKMAQLKEYQELVEFYQKKLSKKIQRIADADEFWKESWVKDDEYAAVDEALLKGLAMVCEDRDYELLFLSDEGGKRYFDSNLFRHLKLLYDFEKLVLSDSTSNPLFEIHKAADFDSIASAERIKNECFAHLKHFFKRQSHFANSELYQNLSYAVLALMLSSSHKNVVTTQELKTSSDYFRDFVSYLRKALNASDYLEFAAKDFESLDHFIRDLLDLAYVLSMHLFYREGARDKVIGLMNHYLSKKQEGQGKVQRNQHHIWNSLHEEYEYLDKHFQQYPSGPVHKILSDATERRSFDVYEPLGQDCYPSCLYQLQNDKLNVKTFHIPSPTKQSQIHKVTESGMFTSFIRAVKLHRKEPKLLYFNLQDRTSWKESSRSRCLEALREKGVHKNVLTVCTLAYDTDFYHQYGEYSDVHKASDFKKMLLEQVESGEECGFFFPEEVQKKEIVKFTKNCIDLIHDKFFSNKGTLCHKNRQDFIEIYYYFLSLFTIDSIQPTMISFSCKDGIDSGSVYQACFYAFAKLMGPDDVFSDEEEDFFMYMTQSSALLRRKRLVSRERFERGLSAISNLSAELEISKSKLIKDFEKLFGYPIFKHLVSKEYKTK